jgi:putative ABC transport system permease protein
MNLTGFVWANLFRKRWRTALTLASLVMAFLLFGLLQAVSNAFSAGADFVGASRLITQARVSFTQSLPMRHLRQIENVPGVAAVNYAQWFGGIYQTERNFFPQFAVEPDRLFAVYPEWTLTDGEKERFRNIRASAIVGKQLAIKYNWKVGDQIPLTSTIWPLQDGSKNWTFEVAGIFGGIDADWESRANLMYLNFAYFDEARQFGRGAAGTYGLKLVDSNNAAQVAQAVDALFENSPDETKTQTEKDFNLGFFKQIGDIGLLVSYVLVAVFFTLLMVLGNTMAQSVRERIPELAVLKTLGFTDMTMLMVVFAEALLLTVIGAILGMLLAGFILVGLSKAIQIPFQFADVTLWLQALLIAVGVAFLVGFLPALRAKRLKIVDALAGR